MRPTARAPRRVLQVGVGEDEETRVIHCIRCNLAFHYSVEATEAVADLLASHWGATTASLSGGTLRPKHGTTYGDVTPTC